MRRRDFLTGAAGLVGASLASRLALANVPTPFSFDMSPPMNDKAKFIAWGVAQRGEEPKFLGERFDRFLAMVRNEDLVDDRNKRAFLLTPREDFVLKQNLSRAYDHAFLDIGYGVTISGPHIVGRMTSNINPKQGEKVLEVGTGSGYQSAYLSHLTDKVFTIEIIKPLAERTRGIYDQLIKDGYTEFGNITCDRSALRAGGKARGRRDDGQRPRLRAVPRPHPRQSHPRQGRGRPAAGLGRQDRTPHASGRRPTSALGPETRQPGRPLGLIRPVAHRPVSVRLETYTRFRTSPGHGRDGLRQLRRPPRRREDQRPRMSPREIDEARSAAAAALAEAKHPETGTPLFPRIIETAEAYQIDPTREGYPDLIALPDEPYWVRTKLTSGRVMGRARPESSRHSPTRRNRGSGRRGPRARDVISRPISSTPRPRSSPCSGMAIPAHVEGKPIVGPGDEPRGPRTARRDAPGSRRRSHRRPSSQRPFEYTAEEQQIIEQRLADLGYLE